MSVGQNLKLLVIDDNLDDCRHLVWLLNRQENPLFSIATISHEEAKTSFRQFQLWDAILLKIHVADQQGLKTLDAIRNNAQAVPVVVLTDEVDDNLGMTSLRRGARDYLATSEVSGPGLAKLLIKTVVRTAVQRHARTRTNQAAFEQTFSAVLDRLPMGVLVVDVDSRVIFINGVAKKIISGGGLTVDEDGFCRAKTPTESAELNGLLSAALYPGRADNLDEASALTLSRASEQAPLSLMVSAIGNDRTFHGAVIFLVDPDNPVAISNQALVKLYGLTPTEARLVNGLVSGGRLEDLAQQWRVSLHTLRAQLKQIFAKTETRRQSDLIKRVLTGPAVLGRKVVPEKGPRGNHA